MYGGEDFPFAMVIFSLVYFRCWSSFATKYGRRDHERWEDEGCGTSGSTATGAGTGTMLARGNSVRTNASKTVGEEYHGGWI